MEECGQALFEARMTCNLGIPQTAASLGHEPSPSPSIQALFKELHNLKEPFMDFFSPPVAAPDDSQYHESPPIPVPSAPPVTAESRHHDSPPPASSAPKHHGRPRKTSQCSKNALQPSQSIASASSNHDQSLPAPSHA